MMPALDALTQAVRQANIEAAVGSPDALDPRIIELFTRTEAAIRELAMLVAAAAGRTDAALSIASWPLR
jgi:hypothetical protein